MIKHRFLVACALSALTIAAPAFAQTAPDPSGDAQSNPLPGTGDAAGSAQSDADAQSGEDVQSGNEVVVTAQGRAQALADVPLAISAVNGAMLERSGANDIRQLNQVAPSLLVSSTGNEANGSARLRGVGTVGDNPGLESSVAVFIDGVYRSRSGIGLNELGDIDRVEVLRGPQGTLFGRNASAGIISVFSKAPDLNRFSAGGEATYGNYDYYRLAGNVNVPLGDTLAGRIDAVYVKRDGFYHDVNNDTDVNDRNRYFVRGQLLFEPSDRLSVRLIGDYTHRNEKCCGAVYIGREQEPSNGDLLTTKNPIIPVLVNLGQSPAAFTDAYSRDIYVTPGRTTKGKTQDWGVSGQVDYDFGNVKLTSITAYREYYNYQAADADYSTVDLLYRAPGGDAGRREFHTFSQELRLNGKLFGDRLDWLVGGYFANEDLEVRDNLKFGSQFGRFASCRILASGALAPYQDATKSGCLSTAARAAVFPAVFGAAAPAIIAGFDRLDQVRNVGDTVSVYDQNSKNYAFFTHNIFTIASGLDLTLGARYTHERKKLDATFGQNNTYCPAQQAALSPFLANAGLAAVAGGLIALTCQGNATSELNGVSINDSRTEKKFTGTAILSYKVTPDLLVYGSAARGYKAGGFNLDRSALKNPLLSFASLGGAQALVGNLEFDPEINTAFEIGAKYSTPMFSMNVAAFHQAFKNFQLNTFNGSVYLVQNINSCKTGLNNGDRDLSAATGACSKDDVQPGVISQGVEVEATINPSRYYQVNAGITYADTHYRNDLIGNKNGLPLDPALRLLPGQNLSNAPKVVVTNSASWTPPVGHGGLSALFYVDSRLSSGYNTGSDLFPQKIQDGFWLVNARVGLRGPDQRWSVELWAQNLLNKNYEQVAFSTPFQAASGVGANANFPAAQYPAGTQVFSAFLAEPRTYGVTLRGRF